jgi:NTP pyrophosphatase (non-canonical NTP hydrolase)
MQPQPPQYRPISIEQKLGYLVEECGEVLAAVGKTQRWGLDSCNPEVGASRETNREWILRELSDLEHACGILRVALDGSCE